MHDGDARRQRMIVMRTTHDSSEDACPVREAEAISLTTALSRMAWAMSGRPSPTYTRAEIPVRFVDRG